MVKVSFQNKVKFALWAYPETLKDVAVHYKNDNCKSQSEFIEKRSSSTSVILMRKKRELHFTDDYGNGQSYN